MPLIPLFVSTGGGADPVTGTSLTTGGDSANLTAYTTASISPTADRLLLAAVVFSTSTTVILPPTLTGLGLTWTFVNSVVAGSDDRLLCVYKAVTGASPGSGAVTITPDVSNAATGMAWNISEFNADISNPVVQNAIGSNTATQLSVALGAGVTSGNGTYLAAFNIVSETWTADTGAILGQIVSLTPTVNIATEFASVGVSPMLASTPASNIKRGVVLELKAPPAVGNVLFSGWGIPL